MLREWTDTWVSAVSSDDSTFDDPMSKVPEEARRILITRLQELVGRLVSIVDRKHRDQERAKHPSRDVLSLRSLALGSEGILAALHNAYEGPGALRTDGPSHDNDFVNIGDIQIAPTHGELTSALQPFLPANLYGAPHPLPAESMEQLLDIQFRLLREELTYVSSPRNVYQLPDIVPQGVPAGVCAGSPGGLEHTSRKRQAYAAR